ncbi:MAG TPA: hypothetical protein VNN15_06665, partial [Solirubrobacterales bacterium]|nr:hypothetical protein [Solirubrobacterales bacterium]
MLAAFISIMLLWLVPASAPGASCPNEALRDAASATLPDCRAYELVSSPDANGRLLWGISSFGLEISRDLFPTELASPSKDSIVYEAYSGPLPNLPEPNGIFDIYEAQRFSAGWQTVRRLSPSGPQSVRPTSGGVSSDHSYAFSFAPAGISGFPVGSLAGKAGTDYLIGPDGSFELTGIGSLGSEPLAQGRYISLGGEHVIFSTGNQQGQSQWCTAAISDGNQCAVLKLEEDAGATGTGTIYDRAAD